MALGIIAAKAGAHLAATLIAEATKHYFNAEPQDVAADAEVAAPPATTETSVAVDIGNPEIMIG